MRDSFVFYSSFLDTIERAPEQVRLSLFTELCNCGLERKKLSEVEYPVCLFVTQAMANVERSNKRYEQAVENATWEDAYMGNYRSKMAPQALIASILAWLSRYRCQVIFCRQRTSGRLIYDILYREAREHLERTMLDEG